MTSKSTETNFKFSRSIWVFNLQVDFKVYFKVNNKVSFEVNFKVNFKVIFKVDWKLTLKSIEWILLTTVHLKVDFEADCKVDQKLIYAQFIESTLTCNNELESRLGSIPEGLS